MMIHKRIWEMTQGVRKFIFLKSGVGILISISYIVQAVFLGKIIMQVYGHENVENLYFNLIIFFIQAKFVQPRTAYLILR